MIKCKYMSDQTQTSTTVSLPMCWAGGWFDWRVWSSRLYPVYVHEFLTFIVSLLASQSGISRDYNVKNGWHDSYQAVCFSSIGSSHLLCREYCQGVSHELVELVEHIIKVLEYTPLQFSWTLKELLGLVY
ncbi:hypothetical protein PHMEG_00010943 [Phytophthora megakarya]|uniref:Uncharacterized protein n=1 Tax=Phytophthora megakarya TaxID=4795 RepID=A0A225WCY6_9STRA|nr:hypothetical protein PHMEG_00010943 [Phytophthora megakarya]